MEKLKKIVCVIILASIIQFVFYPVGGKASSLERIDILISQMKSSDNISVFTKNDENIYPGYMLQKKVSIVNNNSFSTILDGISLSNIQISNDANSKLNIDDPAFKEFIKYAKLKVVYNNKTILDTKFENLIDKKNVFSDYGRLSFDKDESKDIEVFVSLDEAAGNYIEDLICTYDTNMYFISDSGSYIKTGESTPWIFYIIGLSIIAFGVISIIRRNKRQRYI